MAPVDASVDPAAALGVVADCEFFGAFVDAAVFSLLDAFGLEVDG